MDFLTGRTATQRAPTRVRPKNSKTDVHFSHRVGEGATFTFTVRLPLAQAQTTTVAEAA